MSIERELLKELITKDMVQYYYPKLVKNVEAILAQPEQTEQEPVAWMNEAGGCFLSDGIKYSNLWTPLYTKREPLSEDDVDTCLSNAIKDGWYPVDEDSYRQGFLDAVKEVNNEMY